MAATEREIERLIVRLVGDGKQYEQTLRAAGTQTKKYTQDLQGRLRDAQGKFVNMQQRMALGITRTGRALGPVSAAFTRFGARVMAVGNTLGAFLAKVRAGLLKFAIYVVAPAAAIFKLGSDFEAEMSKIVGLVGVARDQVNAWSKDILRLAPQLGKAPKEMAQAMFFVTSAGARGEKAMEVLTRSAKASAAGLGETKTVADAVTSAMNAYARTGMTAARATDILTAAVREGKLEASALAPVMGRVLPMASAMGVRFEDVAGAMAVMSRTGAEANQAATSIQALMMALQKPTAEATELLKSAGLSFGDLRDMVRKPGGVIEALRLLESRFKFNDTALATLIPNVRALRGVMNVLAQDATIVDSVMSGVHDSVGATERAFREAAKTAKFKFWQSVSELKVALIELGEVAIPIIVDAVKLLTGAVKLLVGDLQRIAPAVEGAHKAGQKIAEIAGPLWQKATKYATGPGLASLWYEKVFGSGDTGAIPARQQRRIDALVNNVHKAFELPEAPSGLNISEAFGGWGKQLQSLVRLDPSKVLDSLRQGLPDTTAYMEGLASVTGRVAKAFGEGRGALESYLAGEARLRLDAKSLTEALQHQAATLGMSAEEAQIDRLANRGLGKELLKDARAAAKQIKEYRELQEVHKQTADFMQEGQRAVQQYLSPQEKFIKRQQDLYGWLALEVITQKQFNSMLKEAKERLDALDTDVTVRFHVTGIQAVQKGTAEAAALLAEYRGGLAPGTLRRPGGKQGGIQNFVPKDLTGGGLGRGGRTDTQVVERLDHLVDIALQQLNKTGMTIEEADLEG